MSTAVCPLLGVVDCGPFASMYTWSRFLWCFVVVSRISSSSQAARVIDVEIFLKILSYPRMHRPYLSLVAVA
jgi:hypothetical protein